LNLRRSAFR